MNPLTKATRSVVVKDVLGVARGLLRVGLQIAKRVDHASSDAVYLMKNVENQLSGVQTKFDETKEFFEAAENVLRAGEGEEIITFEKPVFQYQKKQDSHFRESAGTPDPVATQVQESRSSAPIQSNPEPTATKATNFSAPEANLSQEQKKAKTKYNIDDYLSKKAQEFSNAQEKKVPSTSFSRALEFSKVGSTILGSTFTSYIGSMATGNTKSLRDFALTEENAERLGNALCKMRGAALKLGQAMSMQEDQFLPEPIKKAFQKARQSANIMPKWQLEKILVEAYGDNWKEEHFKEFELRPFAAASIGQVHRGVLHDGTRVVLKIQYPGVSSSIDSDLDNLKRLMNYTGVFPKSMFLDDFIKNTRIELKEECDYVVEKEKQIKYHELCKGVAGVEVPKIVEKLCRPNILAMYEIEGIDLDTCAKELSQDERNHIGTKVMEVTLREIFEWRFMQTDPNFANFFYNPNSEILYLLDLGAGKDYDKNFCKNYLDTVWGAANNDPALILKATTELGFLSGQENPEMIKAHIQSIITVGQPFSKPGLFDFGNQTMTREIYELMPVMLKNRLKPPPPEVYSLHRKLSGAYLMNIHLKSKIPSRELFQEIYRKVEPQYRA